MLLSTLSCKLGRSHMIPRTLFQRTLIIRVSIDNTTTSASGFVFIVASVLFFLSFSVHGDIFSIHFIRLFGCKIPLISRLFVELCPNALSCNEPFSVHTYTNNRTDIHVLLPGDDWCLQSKNACVTVIKKEVEDKHGSVMDLFFILFPSSSLKVTLSTNWYKVAVHKRTYLKLKTFRNSRLLRGDFSELCWPLIKRTTLNYRAFTSIIWNTIFQLKLTC